MMNRAFTLLLALAGACTASFAQDIKGDAAVGVGKAAMCIGCHGIKGYQASFPEVYRVPMIAGQGSKYIVASLQAYAKGDRKHPTMRAVATSLSDQDMADLGAFYEKQGKDAGAGAAATLAASPPDALKDRLQICLSCHGANFSSPIDPGYPKLAGQHADYLFAAMKSYGTDANPHVGRTNPTMRSQVVQEADGKKKALYSSAELKVLAKYLASLPGDLHTVPQKSLR